jgi:deoxyribonuclease V
MHVIKLHPWRLSYEEAVRVQEQLRHKISLEPLTKPIQLVAGADVSCERNNRFFYSSVVVFTFPDLELIEEANASLEIDFPYIPGLLSFREAPVLIKAFQKLRNTPDVILFDGQGIAHPRGVGLASHMGLILGLPTIGCAKTRLTGKHGTVPEEKGGYSLLKSQGQTIGAVLRTRERVKPMFISPGHEITLKESIRIVLETCRGYRLPEPTRQAHLAVNRFRIVKSERF